MQLRRHITTADIAERIQALRADPTIDPHIKRVQIEILEAEQARRFAEKRAARAAKTRGER